MLSRISKVVLLAGCLVAAGGASAFERSDVVPVIAGVAVGALLVSTFNNSHDDRHRHDYRQPQRVVHYAPRPSRHHRYRHAPRQIRYVAVPVREARGHYRNDRNDRGYRNQRNHRDYRRN
ncbi:MAG: hypothetical protein R3355_06170 [Pseudomonas sp.]|uniref:hypothetical protein n=1 Tax=Pseudomonas sp. TaxID=306 RepID=UPI00299EF9AF|nr:hypothetical protein [Pseudomonas sp.]MDX1722685.1 hypothetical protein [Pseudomonas sp.]